MDLALTESAMIACRKAHTTNEHYIVFRRWDTKTAADAGDSWSKQEAHLPQKNRWTALEGVPKYYSIDCSPSPDPLQFFSWGAFGLRLPEVKLYCMTNLKSLATEVAEIWNM